MHDIQAQNRHAFIQGDVNRLRQGIALNLAHSPAHKPQQTSQNRDSTYCKINFWQGKIPFTAS